MLRTRLLDTMRAGFGKEALPLRLVFPDNETMSLRRTQL